MTDTGTIVGNVIDAKTNQPLPTATVYVGTIVHNVVPADKGQFTLMNVPVGQQTLTVQAIGYATDRELIAVTKNQESQAGDAGQIRMTPTI
ncbi:MAG: carboxypeptidase-like regulatory domain-containing protein [Candidatus Velthaea sp.]